MAGEAPPGERPLTSWKDIATHFDRDVRTVQRWEKDEALPVHRHPHHNRASVYAYPSELERWWQRREPEPDARPAARGFVGVGVAVVSTAIAVGAALLTWSPAAAPAGVEPEARRVARLTLFDGASATQHRVLAGDVNGDGRTDLVVSAPDLREVYVVFGDVPEQGQLPATADVTLRSAAPADLVAAAVADFNGDGKDDLAFANGLREPETFHGTGDTLLVFGRDEWPASLELPRDADVSLGVSLDHDIRMGPCDQGARFDLDRDGTQDLVLAAYEFSAPRRASAGGVFVFFGRRQWPARLDVFDDANVRVVGARMGEALGAFCAEGDWNGDGLPDLVASASESNLWGLRGTRGRIYVIGGRPVWPAVVDTASDFLARFDGEAPIAGFNQPLVGDVNGDGRDDVVTVWAATDDRTARQVTMHFGRCAPPGLVVPATHADVRLSWPEGADIWGRLSLGDVDFDGAADLVAVRADRAEAVLVRGRAVWPDHGPLDALGGVVLGGVDRPAPTGCQLADVTGDGLLELVLPVVIDGKAVPHAGVSVVSLYRSVPIDIRPDHSLNVLFVPGLVVARLPAHDETGDPIEPASIRLGGLTPLEVQLADRDGDGVPELNVYVETDELAVTAHTVRLAFSARTTSGRLVGGADDVEVILKRPRPASVASWLGRR